jgi:23S rRNA (uracil1939-C5)-methyltransferase
VDLSKVKKIIIKTNQDKILLHVFGDIDNINSLSYVDTIICNNKVIKGNGYLEEVIDNKIFKITSEAFFQVNKEGLVNINNIIKKFLKDKNINAVLDLYSGTSLWGILVSDYVKKVTSVEINKEACDDANYNIDRNNIKNVQVINDDVKNIIDSFNNIDLVIVDPPRSGLDQKTREYLKKIYSKYIIYISCDMKTLQRDLNELKDIYVITETNIVDMFRGTYHCEVVTILERKK